MFYKYCQKHKERLRNEPRARYQNLSKEEKDKRWKKVRGRYQNIPEGQKQKLLDSMKIHYLAHKK